MKDPCEKCPPRLKNKCNKEESICVAWEQYLFSKATENSTRQMRLTQYTEEYDRQAQRQKITKEMEEAKKEKE